MPDDIKISQLKTNILNENWENFVKDAVATNCCPPLKEDK